MNLRENRSVSPPRASRAWLASALAVTLVLAACGKKGPLYLPDQAAAPGAGPAAAQPAKK